MVGTSIEITWWELTGLLGAVLYAGSYLCAAFDRIPSQSIHYYLVKLVAAVLVLVSLSNSFNLASVVIQVFFITVSLIGMARHISLSRRDALLSAFAQSETADRNCLRRSDFG